MSNGGFWRDIHVAGSGFPVSLGFERISSLSSAASLTVPDGTSVALIQAEQEDIRYRADGVDPTDTVGMLISAGNEVLYPASKKVLDTLRFIGANPGAVLNVSYY